MINKVELTHFQSHKNSVIELVPGVNTFIGTSDQGKSSIMRAILLVNDNKPSGTAFVSHWATDAKGKIKEDAKVELTLDDGVTLTRIRGVDNAYTITGPGIDEAFRAMNTSVPEEVRDLMNLSDTNIQRQEENFFLFAETSGEVLRRINSYTRLDLIDTALSRAKKDAQETKRDIKTITARIADLGDQLKPYEIVDELETMHSDAETLVSKKQELYNEITKIADYIERYKEITTSLEQFKSVERIQRKISRLIGQDVKRQELSKERASIQEAVTSYTAVKQKMDQLLPDIDISGLIALSEKATTAQKQADEVFELIDSYAKTSKRKKEVTEHLEKLHDKYHDQLGDTCPVCGSSIKDMQ